MEEVPTSHFSWDDEGEPVLKATFDFGDGWHVVGFFRVVDGEPFLFDLRILPRVLSEAGEVDFPADASASDVRSLAEVNPYGITSRVLREVRLREMVDSVRRRQRALRPHDAPGAWTDDSPELKSAIAKAKRRPTGKGRTGRSDQTYALWAYRYSEIVNAEDPPRRPIADLASRYRVSPVQVRDYVHRARERGFLTKAGQGRVGGSLTPEGRRVLMGDNGHDS